MSDFCDEYDYDLNEPNSNSNYLRKEHDALRRHYISRGEQGHRSLNSSSNVRRNHIPRRDDDDDDHEQPLLAAGTPIAPNQDYVNRQLIILEQSRIQARRPSNDASTKEIQLYNLHQAYNGASLNQTIHKLMGFFGLMRNLSVFNIVVGLSVLLLIATTTKWTHDSIIMGRNLETQSARNINQSWVDLMREVTPLMDSVMMGNYYNCIGRKSLEERRTDVENRIENDNSVRNLKLQEIVQEQIQMCISRKQTSNGYLQIYKQDETFEHAYCINKYLDLVFPSTPRELKDELETYLSSNKMDWKVDCIKTQLIMYHIYVNQTDYIRSIHAFTKHIGKCEEARLFDSSISC